mgnify:CR=1 FL=1
MIITCPDCETQFLVNNADIIPDGRDVRCSRCDYQWYVAPSSDGASDGASEWALNGDADESVACVVLTGAGRAFTVGLDLKELGGEKAPDAKLTVDPAEAMAETPQPIIGAINGSTSLSPFQRSKETSRKP